ncbi:MAG: GrpB family protein, partial [Allobaculum sp.]|nr:GrpB family protein [Allobaculum sp.]
MKDNCLATYHIGSTSIPGMKAKPINDIMPVVQNLEEVEALIPEFEKLGYEFRGEWGLPGRYFFRKEDDARTHYVHIYQVDNHYEIKRHLAFPKEYALLKESLALQDPYDLVSYDARKDPLIK